MIINNARLLVLFVKDVFGSLLVAPDKWPLVLDSNISVGRTFFYDRRKQRVPLSQGGFDRLRALYRCALTNGSGCAYDPVQISWKICEAFASIAPEIDVHPLKFHALDSEETRSAKREMILDVFNLLAIYSEGREFPDLDEFRKMCLQKLQTSILDRFFISTDAVPMASTTTVQHAAPKTIRNSSETSMFIQKRFSSLDDAHFCGRETQLQLLYEILANTGQCLVTGMGGIGKSELVRKYANRHRGDYRQILWFSYEKSLIHTLSDDTKFQIRGMSRVNFDFEDDTAYALRKLRILQEEAAGDTLVVLDNYDEEGDPLMGDFLTGNYTLVVTSRITRNFQGNLLEICLTELDDNEILGVFANAYLDAGGVPELLYEEKPTVNNSEKTEHDSLSLSHLRKTTTEIDAISYPKAVRALVLDGLKKHTYSVVLAASLLATERVDGALLSPIQLLQAIHEADKKDKDIDNIHHRILLRLDALFRLTTLSEDELYFLKNLSLVSISGISVRDICRLCRFTERENYAKTIDTLIKRNWVLYDRSRDAVSLHVLVRTLLLDSIQDTETTFDSFLKYLWDTWDEGRYSSTGPEKEKFYQWTSSAESSLPHSHRQHYYFKKLRIILMHGLNAQQALQELTDLPCPNQKEYLSNYAWRAQYLFWLGRFQEAHDLLIEQYQRIKATPIESWPTDCGGECLFLIERMPEIFRVLGKYEASLEACKLCLIASEKWCFYNSFTVTKAWIYYHFGRTYLRMGQMDLAAENLKSAKNLFDKLFQSDQGGIYMAFAMFYIETGDFQKAEEMLIKLFLCLSKYSYKNAYVFEKYWILQGDFYLKQKIWHEAKDSYEKALHIASLHKDKHFILLIDRRMLCIQNGTMPSKEDLDIP